jgi:hypothetical protein
MLLGQCNTKKVCQISIWGDALGLQHEPLPYLKIFWSFLYSKSYNFWKFHLHCINQNFILCHPLFSIGTGRRPPHQSGFCVFKLFRGGADRRRPLLVTGPGGVEKIGGLTSPWQTLVKLFSLRSRPYIQPKWGMGIPEMNQKGEIRTGY